MSQTTALRLPDFLIVGAQKGGTWAMAENLARHPDIFVLPKEVGFFAHDQMSLEEYCSLFPATVPCVGEKTPRYMFHDHSRRKMFQVHPDAKLIITLRDPVRRFHSAYNHYVQVQAPPHWDSWQRRSPEELLQEGERSSMIARGYYVEQIRALLNVGFRRDQLHITISERVRANMRVEYNRVYEFLGVSPYQTEFNSRRHTREYVTSLSPRVREQLHEIYEPWNRRLFEFLGQTVDEWDRPARVESERPSEDQRTV